ncbi:Sel1-like repeat-containing protein [Megavirus chiliensis]|uniref:Sel1-like repeat-containing n=2 Tax=Megamimivirinae TaxID=3044648 RepID=A0A2L2DP43_MIMIV|nr:putative Sel1-like repeat-containing protein [Megavirus chiliensis]AEQ32463.1 Sel1-like repeat-containing protein [Megavirus chiliensis]AVG47887.1 Sel1-like repeat-containing [Acanthamoeba polyphaga mimivirus]
MDYQNKSVKELAKLAENDDIQAQDEIINRYMIHGKDYLIEYLVDIFKWNNLYEKCLENQKYIYVVIQMRKPNIYYEIIEKLYPIIESQAVSDNALAQCNLGCITNGIISIRWFQKSADRGCVYAQCELAKIYIDRFFYKLAYDYARPAAKSGNAVAENILGNMYSRGWHVSINHDKALKWYTRSAEKNYAHGQISMSIYYSRSNRVDYNPLLEFEWIKKAAKQGFVQSQYEIACRYDQPNFKFHDKQKALKWYKRAADGGNTSAQEFMASKCLSDGDIAQALYWYFKSKSKYEIMEYLTTQNHNVVHVDNYHYNCHNSEMELFRKKFYKHFQKNIDNILPECQILIIKNKYHSTDEFNDFRYKYCEILENHIIKIIKWDIALTNISTSEFIISCLGLKTSVISLNIQEYQDKTGIIPWIKQFRIQNNYYLVFGENNVELIEEIIGYKNQMINRHDEFINLINKNSDCEILLSDPIIKLYKQILKTYNLMLSKLINEDNIRNIRFQAKYKFLYKY